MLIPTVRTQVPALEKLRAWKNLQFTEEETHLERTRNQWLLQAYTGFYYNNLINLKKEYLHKDHEYGYMVWESATKTRNEISFLCLDFRVRTK
jgi:hypothetical protein